MHRGLELRRQRLGDVARALPRPEQILGERRQRLDVAVARLPRPAEMLAARRDRLGFLAHRLPQALDRRAQVARVALSRQAGRLSPRLVTQRIERQRDRLAALARLYGSLHYQETLKRGYALVRDGTDTVLTRAKQVAPGAALRIEFADGRVGATAEGEAPPRPRRRKPGPGDGGGDGGGTQGSLF
jgi:exodeoxyribonuclease VII large subunit